MKVHFTVSCEMEVDPSDWRDCETFEKFIGDLEEACLDNIDDPTICVDAMDAAWLWATVRPDDIEAGNVEELNQCNVCNKPIRGEAFINTPAGGTGLAHPDCIADGHIDSKTGKFTPAPSA